ncbi:hypothetical protein [Halovivax limisalsi]|uniref:hypothetical protein n=1 Tax=Halovivax limisalsi TaxID=1453760 RepID=UPI001FFCFB17|nr:hypothetical protein [Halovivax limisalsi]
MNRRTLLSALGGLGVFGFAGYLVAEMRLSLPILIRAQNETETNRNITIEAYETGSDRQTFERSFNVPAGGTATPGRLSNSDAYVAVELMEAAERREGSEPVVSDTAETFTGERTQRITVRITEDGLELETESRDN